MMDEKTAHTILHLHAVLRNIEKWRAEAEAFAEDAGAKIATPAISIKRPFREEVLQLPTHIFEKSFLIRAYLRWIERQRVDTIRQLKALGVADPYAKT